MRKIRDMLRLTAAGMSSRQIAASLSIGGTTVVDCLRRARAVGVGWPLPEDLSDAALEARLFPASMALAAIKSRRAHRPTGRRPRCIRPPKIILSRISGYYSASRLRSDPSRPSPDSRFPTALPADILR
jgi:hypothetical protein